MSQNSIISLKINTGKAVNALERFSVAAGLAGVATARCANAMSEFGRAVHQSGQLYTEYKNATAKFEAIELEVWWRMRCGVTFKLNMGFALVIATAAVLQ